jgi:hypothetical protein
MWLMVQAMTIFEITYIRSGSGERKLTDRVVISERDEFEFEDGTFTVHNITDAIEAFELVASKWWGTYETKNAITSINVVER